MRVGTCPSCGAPVEFRPGAGKVKVCEHCNTVVLRGEAGLEKVGKVAELVDTESPLKLGLTGRFSGAPFTVAGRLQKSNGAGTWDEWYLQFDDEREAWLAESEGEWKLLFPLSGAALPDISRLEPLSSFTLREKHFVVEEVNSATTVGAQGQLPDFNSSHRYVDATGPRGVFCSLDLAGSVAEGYVGSIVTLDSLGFDRNELEPTPRKDALSAARCTECNGMLDLKAPDATKRVACPYCGALLSIEAGKLSFLQLLERPPYEPEIPLGAKGRLFDPTEEAPAKGKPAGQPPEWTCLAFLIRSCEVEGTRYPWNEYLLWNREKGFRWLMQSNGHWTWLRPVAAGEATLSVRVANFHGTSLRAYQSVFTRTDFVLGECYWAVEVGERARATEFVAPPFSLNVDQTSTEATLTWGTLIDKSVVEKTFGLKQPLPKPEGIAPAQVNEFKAKAWDAAKWAGIWSCCLIALMVVFSTMGTTQTYFQGAFSTPPEVAGGSPEAQRFTETFVVPKAVPLEVTIVAGGLDNGWLGVSADLVNQDTGEVISVYGEPSYYSGVDDGERWSEGSREVTKQTDVVDPGNYLVRLTPSFDPGRPFDYSVKVAADDGAQPCCPISFIIVLLLSPLYFWVRASGFETAKWNDSVFQSANE